MPPLQKYKLLVRGVICTKIGNVHKHPHPSFILFSFKNVKLRKYCHFKNDIEGFSFLGASQVEHLTAQSEQYGLSPFSKEICLEITHHGQVTNLSK